MHFARISGQQTGLHQGLSITPIRKNPVFRAVRVYARKLEGEDYRLEDALLRLSDAFGDLTL